MFIWTPFNVAFILIRTFALCYMYIVRNDKNKDVQSIVLAFKTTALYLVCIQNGNMRHDLLVKSRFGR